MTDIAARLDLDIDISGQAGLDGCLHTAVTIHLPRRETMWARPIVIFAFPGGGAGRGTWCMEAPTTLAYSQARWHAERGIVFVSCDHLGTGDSSQPDPELLTTPYPLAWANHATVDGVLTLLASGRVTAGYGAVLDPVTIGIGHSMGANLTIVLQAHRQVFDGVGILGYSAIHTALPVPDGIDPRPHPRAPRADPDVRTFRLPDDTRQDIFRYMNRWDAEEADEMRRHQWRLPLASVSMPPAAMYMNAAGVVLEEASWIEVPVFLGFGERDVTRNPWEEPRWFWRARDVQLAVVPRMSHGLNSAATRVELWRRLHHWALGIGDAKHDTPLAPS